MGQIAWTAVLVLDLWVIVACAFLFVKAVQLWRRERNIGNNKNVLRDFFK